jgi:hypothetical protein
MAKADTNQNPSTPNSEEDSFDPRSNAWAFQSKQGGVPPTPTFREALANHPSTNH